MPDGFIDQFLESFGIEIDIGQGGKNRLAGKVIEGRVTDTRRAALQSHLGQPLDRIDQQILKRRHIRLLAAYADLGASLAFCRLLTLKTKHDFFLLG